jgi:hypothetical protein
VTYSTKLVLAQELGYIVPNWHIEDYLRDSIDHMGWESIAFNGPKGGAKSNLLLQLMYIIFKNWEDVKRLLMFSPINFLEITSEPNTTLPLITGDDISVWLPRSLYFTDRTLWSAFKQNWDSFRTIVYAFLCSAPLKEHIASFITDDLTGEVFIGRRVKGAMAMQYDFQRFVWSVDFESPTKTAFAKVRVEKSWFPLRPEDKVLLPQLIKKSNPTWTDEQIELEIKRFPGVPDDVWNWYQKNRYELADSARDKLHKLIQKVINKQETASSPNEISESARALGRRSHIRDRG